MADQSRSLTKLAARFGIATLIAAASLLAAAAGPASASTCPTSNNWSWDLDGRGPSSGPLAWYTAPTRQPVVVGNPLSGVRWFVDCQWDEAWMGSRIVEDWDPRVHRYRRRVNQRPAMARLLSTFIARNPIAKWFGPTHTGMYNTVYNYLVRTNYLAPGAMRFVVFRRLESGNCRRYVTPNQRIYGPGVHRKLVDSFAAAVRAANRDGFGSPLTVVIEPDVLASIECTLPTIRGAAARRRFLRTRLAEISYAIGKFAPLPLATAYVDAGASDYVGWKAQVKYLRAVGIKRIRGFSLNVTHYDWTRDNVEYGRKLAGALGVHFVVSTGRAGGGNLPDRLLSRGYERGCNIPNAGLGPVPTVRTASRYADAYLWLLNPGFSDGNCKSGRRSFRTPNVRWTQTLAVRLIRQRCQSGPRCFGRGRPTYFE